MIKDEELLQELLLNEEFIQQIYNCSNREELYDLCKKQLKSLSKEKFDKMVNNFESITIDLADENLEEVAGGVVKRLLKDTPD